jgi:hypothetical protein
MPPLVEGLGMPQQKCPRISPLGIHPYHGQKALPGHIMIPDGLSKLGLSRSQRAKSSRAEINPVMSERLVPAE